jgi:hypothetical protein
MPALRRHDVRKRRYRTLVLRQLRFAALTVKYATRFVFAERPISNSLLQTRDRISGTSALCLL